MPAGAEAAISPFTSLGSVFILSLYYYGRVSHTDGVAEGADGGIPGCEGIFSTAGTRARLRTALPATQRAARSRLVSDLSGVVSDTFYNKSVPLTRFNVSHGTGQSAGTTSVYRPPRSIDLNSSRCH